MSHKFRKEEMRAFFKTCLIALLVDLLAFPPGLTATEISWNGGTGNYSNASRWSCGGCGTYPNNPNPGGPFDATINSGLNDVVNLDVTGVIVNSMTLGGSGPSSSSTLNVVGGNDITFGAAGTSGDALTISNGGILNVNGGSATLNLSTGTNSALNDIGGQINIFDGNTLTVKSAAGGTITNNGAINLNGAAVLFDGGGTAQTFTVGTAPGGNGTIVLSDSAKNQINGAGGINGLETLALAGGTNLSGAGSINVANFTNGGTIAANFTDNALIVNSNLTNWTASTGTLNGGQYVANGTLRLSSIGTNNSIQTLTNANIFLTGPSALITGDGTTNALSGLTNITDASLNLSGVNGLTITPGSGTLTVTSDPNGTSFLSLDQGSGVTVNGGLHNLTTTDTSQNAGTINVTNGSALTLRGNLLNEADVDQNLQSSTSTVNVLNGSTLNADSLTTSTNNGFANSTINVIGSSLNVTHDLLQGGSNPSSYSGGEDTLNLTYSTAKVGGNFANNNGLNTSAVNLYNSSLTVNGAFTQAQATGGYGTSQLNLMNNSTMTVGGFTNSSGVSGGAPQSQVSITGGSSLTILGNGTFTNVSSGGVLSGGSYLIGTGSSLNYNGANINTIDVGTVLTLDNAGNGIQGALLNGGSDAISNSLTNLNGTLALQNGASLTLSGAGAGTFTVGSNGTLSLQNGSIFDVSAYNFTNVSSSGVLSGGTYFIGTNSTLNYAGSQSSINTIDANASLTLDNAGGGTTGSVTNGGRDALSNSLTNVNGTLALQNGAGLTLAGAAVRTFTVGANGTLSLQNGSNLDVSAYNFTNVTSSGVLSGGTYFIGGNSTLNYAGSQGSINTLDVNTSVTLDNTGGGATGSITYGGSDALSNSLTTNNGNLTLQNGANLSLAQGLTNSSGDTPGGSGAANLLLINGSTLTLKNGAGDLTNTAYSSNGNGATSTVSIGGGLSGGSTLTVNNLNNTAINTNGSFGNAVANINLTGGSSLIVNGNVNNSASVSGNASALIALDGASSLTVGGTYNNTSASLGLTNSSTATITGLFTNDGNSAVNLDLTGNGFSTLTTNGGFSNAGSVVLDFFSTLNNAGTFANSGTVDLYNASQLTSTGLFDNTNGALSLNGGGNTLYAAGFTNTGGSLYIAAGDTADFRTGGLDTFTNLSNGTLSGGAYNIGGTFNFDASAGTGGGRFQTINGASVAINGTGQILYGADGSQGDALAALTNLSLSTLAFNDAGAHTITPVPAGGISTLTLTDSDLNLYSSSLATQTNLTVAGNLANNSQTSSATINLTGSSLTVDGSLVNNSNGSFNSSTINLNSAYLSNGVASVLTGSTLTITGTLNNGIYSAVNLNGGGNVLTAAGLTNNGTIAIGAGDTADFRTGGLDTYTNLVNGTLTGGSLNVSGNFFYDASAGTGGGQILNMQGTGITLQGAGQILYGPDGSRADGIAALTSLTDSSLTLDNLNASRTIAPGGSTLTLTNGQLNVNSSSLEVAGAVVMNTDNNGNSGINLSAGNLRVDGPITNNASSVNDQTISLANLSTLTATGTLINSSTVSLKGGGNQLFATGFTNNGVINVAGGDTADFRNGGAGQFTNLANNTLTGGTYNLSGQLFYDTGSDTSTNIQTIHNANVSLYNTGGGNAAGAILFGRGAGTDALAQLGSLTGGAALTLSGETETFNPNGSNGTFTLNSSTLDLNAYNSTPTALTIQGALLSTNSGVNISGGSSLTVQGGATIDSNSSISLNGGGNSLSGTSLTNSGMLNVGAGDTADFRSGAGILANLTANTLTGGTYNITGSLLYNTGTDGSTYIQTLSGVNMTLGSTSTIGFGSVPTNALAQLGTLTNSSLTINGATLAINPNGNGSMFLLDPSMLSLTGGTILNIGGAVNNTSGSSISLSGLGTTLTANGFTNNGSLTVGAGSTADFRNGGPTGSVTNTFTGLDGSTGTLNGGSYAVAGTFLFDPASGTNGGNILKIGSSTTLTLDGSGGGAQVLYGPGSGTDALASLNDVAGTLNLYNGETRSFTPNGGTLTVDSGATMNLGGSFAGAGVADITGALANNGTINLTNSGSGITTTESFLNTGTLNVNSSGDFVNSQGLNNLGGTINIDNGATLNTGATANSGAAAFTNTGTITTAGTGSNALNVTGNIFNTSPGVVNLNGTADKMTATGQFTNTGAVNLNGTNAAVSSAGLDNQSGGTVTLAGNGNSVRSTGTASNEGTIAFTGTSGSVSSTGNFTNAASGMMTVEGTGNELFTNGNLLNSGAITVSNGGVVTAALGVSQSGTVTIDSNGQLTVASGEYDQSGGTTTINQGGTLTAPTFLLEGGTLAGGGTLEGNLTIAGGTLSPGDPQSIDVIGNYDQQAAGILDIDLAGPPASPSADQVDVTGNVSLDGTLELTLLNGFDAAVGTQFDIVNWTGSETGDFSTFDNLTFDNGTRTFEEVINGNQVDLDVVSTTASATPEPSTLPMLFCAMLMGAGITWRARRRQIKVK